MIDTLVLTHEQTFNLNRFRSSLSGLIANEATLSHRSQYRSGIAFFRERPSDGKHVPFVIVRLEPEHPKAAPTRIEVNPPRFGSASEMMHVLSCIDSPATLFVNRIDHAVDVSLPVERVLQEIWFSRKTAREQYKRGKPTGCYLGKRPEQLCVYDRAKRARQLGPITRIEMRQWRERAAIRRLSELPSLIDAPVFERVLFFEINSSVDAEAQASPKFLRLKSHIDAGGFTHAYQSLNQQKNFWRDHKELIRPSTLIPDLNNMYRDELLLFLNS
jgi:hypothetical protein